MITGTGLTEADLAVTYLREKYRKNNSIFTIKQAAYVVLSFLQFLNKSGANIFSVTRQDICAFVEHGQDHSLSAVDAETEDRVLQGLMTERLGKTNIIVSHRVSTLRHADVILVLDKGRVTQQGSHEKLLADTSGFYAEIARLQELERVAGKGE